jgi:hypothetical protein
VDQSFVPVFGGGAVLAGLTVGALFATTRNRTLALLLLGVLGTFIAYVAAGAAGAFEPCVDCSESHEGVFWNQLLVFGNFLGWTIGVLTGGGARKLWLGLQLLAK